MSTKLGIIGCGKMGSALLKGAINAGAIAPADVTVYDTPDFEKGVEDTQAGILGAGPLDLRPHPLRAGAGLARATRPIDEHQPAAAAAMRRGERLPQTVALALPTDEGGLAQPEEPQSEPLQHRPLEARAAPVPPHRWALVARGRGVDVDPGAADASREAGAPQPSKLVRALDRGSPGAVCWISATTRDARVSLASSTLAR